MFYQLSINNQSAKVDSKKVIALQSCENNNFPIPSNAIFGTLIDGTIFNTNREL